MGLAIAPSSALQSAQRHSAFKSFAVGADWHVFISPSSVEMRGRKDDTPLATSSATGSSPASYRSQSARTAPSIGRRECCALSEAG